jgi:hypothetical protein
MNSNLGSASRLSLAPPESSFAELSSAKEVLEEIYGLLEEFGPMWYTEELHERTLAALKAN